MSQLFTLLKSVSDESEATRRTSTTYMRENLSTIGTCTLYRPAFCSSSAKHMQVTFNYTTP